MLTKHLTNLLIPLFDQCCEKYNIKYNIKNNLLVKSNHADYQFNGLAIIKKFIKC